MLLCRRFLRGSSCGNAKGGGFMFFFSSPTMHIFLSSFVLVVMAKFANNGNSSNGNGSSSSSSSSLSSSVILHLSSSSSSSSSPSPPQQSDNFIQCYFNQLCFCKYDQRTEIYDSLTKLWQDVRFNLTEYSLVVSSLLQVMRQDPSIIYYTTEAQLLSFSKVVGNSSTAARSTFFQPGPVFDIECADVPIAAIPTEYNAHGVISHVSVTGSKLSMLDGSAFAGLEVQGIRLTRNHLYFISEYAFSSMSNSLTMLDLSQNFLDEIPFVAFKSLKLLEWLNLSNNQLNSVAGDWLTISLTLRKLLLASNALDNLPHKLFSSFPRLSWLDLSSNYIHNISQENLPPNLQTLNLMKNRLSHFPSDIFHLRSLSWLFLGGCAIETIPHEWPRGAGPLQMNQLDLSENFIQIWPGKPFGAQLTLFDLSVSKNYLQTLPSAAFEWMNIFRLSLGYNRIHMIDTGAFNSLEMTLKYLNLENNRLKEIPWTALSTLTSLMHFYIGSNVIQDDGIGNPPEGMECKLTYLGLNGNQLSRIPKRTLIHCSRLVHLNLGYNQIIHLDELAHFLIKGKRLRSLSTLILRNNPIRTLAFTNSNHHHHHHPLHHDNNNSRQIIKNTNNGTTTSTSGSSPTTTSSNNIQDLRKMANSKSNIDNLISGGGSSNSPTKISMLGGGGGGGGSIELDKENNNDIMMMMQELVPPQEANIVTSIPNVFRIEVFPNLRELSLSFCQLTGEIEPFPSLPLTTLEISMGLLTATTINPAIFASLRHLEWLALDHNTIHTISPYTFYSNRKLNYLNLEWNRLENLPPQLFHPDIHTSITHLRLSHNAISIIPKNSFISFPGINVDLSYNFIHTIEKYAFIEFIPSSSIPQQIPPIIPSSSATSYDFVSNHNNNNNHSEFKSSTSTSTTSTSSSVPLSNYYFNSDKIGLNLYLGHNRLTSLKTFSFTSNKFSLVDLSYNRLRNFNFETFGVKTIVHGLNLSHNEIERIILPPFNSQLRHRYLLKFLDLSFNRIQNIGIDLRTLCVTDLIDLSNNRLGELNSNILPLNCSVKELNLRSNSITTLDPRSFANLRDLTVLHLERNQILSFLPITLIRNTKLKYLDLSHNRLRTLPRDSLLGSNLETLRLSWNQFVNIPVRALAQISRRLKRLDMSHNSIEHLDSTMFESIPGLLYLNLSSNRLSTLPDSAFANLAALRELDLSRNFLRTNFKELFHFLPKLKVLRLSDCGIKVLPFLPLPHLVTLDLSSNAMMEMKMQNLGSLTRLRHLDLSSNELSGSRLPSWGPLHNLVTLILSNNPLKGLTKDTFHGLGRLETLDLSGMGRLDRFDSDVFSHLVNLKKLSIETYPNIEKYRFRLGAVLSSISHLEELEVNIKEHILSDQLIGGILPKLRKLKITGKDLRKIESNALDGLQNCFHMDLTISQTNIEEIPSKVFELLQSAAWARLDLSLNKISSLERTSLYPNKTVWFSRGTKTFEGGLILDGNEFICDCDLVWIGDWLRRWLRESFQSHSTDNIPLVNAMYESIKKPSCMDSNGRVIPLIDLYSDVMCHASALSSGLSNLKIVQRNESLVIYILLSLSGLVHFRFRSITMTAIITIITTTTTLALFR